MSKIAISGSQCTGKTTLVEALKKHPKFKDYKAFTSMTRGVNNAGFKINVDGDDLTQLLILARHIERTLVPDAEHCIYDRCILDGYVYTHVLSSMYKVDPAVGDTAAVIYDALIDKYDYIFYLPPTIALQSDGQRSVDTRFRNRIVKYFDNMIDAMTGSDSLTPKVHIIDGSVDERVNAIITILEQDKN